MTDKPELTPEQMIAWCDDELSDLSLNRGSKEQADMLAAIRDFIASRAEPVGVAEGVLNSKSNFYTDKIEQLAFELAAELENAELNSNDFVTVNREKLLAISRRVYDRVAASPTPPLSGEWREIESAPINGDLVLGYCPGLKFKYAIVYHDGRYWRNNFNGTTTVRVEKWMPLPEPPKEPA